MSAKCLKNWNLRLEKTNSALEVILAVALLKKVIGADALTRLARMAQCNILIQVRVDFPLKKKGNNLMQLSKMIRLI